MPIAMMTPSVNWSPISEADGLALSTRLREELEGWVGTQYMIGQQCKRVGVDCVRFVGAILDFMGGTTTPLEMLPADTCFHSRQAATAAMHKFRHLFRPMIDVDGWNVQPGDVLVVGPKHGGPGHGVIVGCEPGVLYEAGTSRVQKVGFSFPSCRKVFGVFRKGDRGRWSRPC